MCELKLSPQSLAGLLSSESGLGYKESRLPPLTSAGGTLVLGLHLLWPGPMKQQSLDHYVALAQGISRNKATKLGREILREVRGSKSCSHLHTAYPTEEHGGS